MEEKPCASALLTHTPPTTPLTPPGSYSEQKQLLLFYSQSHTWHLRRQQQKWEPGVGTDVELIQINPCRCLSGSIQSLSFNIDFWITDGFWNLSGVKKLSYRINIVTSLCSFCRFLLWGIGEKNQNIMNYLLTLLSFIYDHT